MVASKNLLLVAWNLFKRHWIAFLQVELTTIAAWAVLELAVLVTHRSGLPTAVYLVVWLSLHVAFLWVFCGLMAGLNVMALQAIDGSVPTFAAGMRGLKRAQAHLVASLLYWIAVFAGLCLAIVPGIVLAVRWSLFRFVLAGTTRSAVSSLDEAASLSASHRWRLFRVLALSVALNLAGAAFLGLGLLIAFPVTVILRASHFRLLQQQREQPGVNPSLFS